MYEGTFSKEQIMSIDFRKKLVFLFSTIEMSYIQ
jgi:hypothetical protein